MGEALSNCGSEPEHVDVHQRWSDPTTRWDVSLSDCTKRVGGDSVGVAGQIWCVAKLEHGWKYRATIGTDSIYVDV